MDSQTTASQYVDGLLETGSTTTSGGCGLVAPANLKQPEDATVGSNLELDSDTEQKSDAESSDSDSEGPVPLLDSEGHVKVVKTVRKQGRKVTRQRNSMFKLKVVEGKFKLDGFIDNSDIVTSYLNYSIRSTAFASLPP